MARETVGKAQCETELVREVRSSDPAEEAGASKGSTERFSSNSIGEVWSAA